MVVHVDVSDLSIETKYVKYDSKGKRRETYYLNKDHSIFKQDLVMFMSGEEISCIYLEFAQICTWELEARKSQMLVKKERKGGEKKNTYFLPDRK